MTNSCGVGAVLVVVLSLWGLPRAWAAEKVTEVSNHELLACFEATQKIFFEAGHDIGPGENLYRGDHGSTQKPLIFVPTSSPEGFLLYTENQVFPVSLPPKVKANMFREWNVTFALPDRGPYYCRHKSLDPKIPAKRSPVWKYTPWANPERESDRASLHCNFALSLAEKKEHVDISKKLKPKKDFAQNLQNPLKHLLIARLEKLVRIFKWQAAKYREAVKKHAEGEQKAADHRKQGVLSVDRLFSGGNPPSKPDRATYQLILNKCLGQPGLREDEFFRSRVSFALRELNSEAIPTYDPETRRCY